MDILLQCRFWFPLRTTESNKVLERSADNDFEAGISWPCRPWGWGFDIPDDRSCFRRSALLLRGAFWCPQKCCHCELCAFPFIADFYSFLYLREGGGIISIIKEELTLQHTLPSAGELILAAGCELAPFCWLDGSRESLLPQRYGQTRWSVSVSLRPFLLPCFLPHSCCIWSPARTFKNVFSPFSWDLALLW